MGSFPFLVLWNPAPWVGVFLLGALGGRFQRPGRWPRWAFRVGLGLCAAAFGTPLQVLAEHSLTAAMGQRLLVTGVAVPLLISALSPAFWRGLWRRFGIVGRFLVRPLIALLLFNGAYGVTAVPGLWNWLCTHPAAFWAQNLLFVALALLFWWPVLSPIREVPRLHPLVALLYLFVGGIALTPLFVFWSLLSKTPAYAVDAAGAHLLSLSAMADERLGGLIMKAGALLAYGVVFVGIFWRWRDDGSGSGEAPCVGSASRTPVDLAEVRRRRAEKQESS